MGSGDGKKDPDVFVAGRFTGRMDGARDELGVGVVLEDAVEWHAPDYCFVGGNDNLTSKLNDGRDDAGFVPRIRMSLKG